MSNRPLIQTESEWSAKLLFIGVVLVAFIDGVLVAAHFYEEKPTVADAFEGVILEVDPFQESVQGASSTPANPEGSSTSATSEQPASTTSSSGLKLEFLSQAPLGTWDAPWDEYAEEASMLMAMDALKGESLPQKPADQAEALRQIGRFERDLFGSSKLTDIPQTARVIQEFFAWSHVNIFNNPTLEDLQTQLSQGALLLIPVNGQILGNPHYGTPGPEHHMILAYKAGLKDEQAVFWVNDPGTRYGEGLAYTQKKILQSMQDLDGSKRVLVLYPED